MIKYITVTFILIAGIIFSCKNKSTTNTSNEFPDQAFLKNAATGWDAQFNSRNLAMLTSLYSEDVVSMPSNSPAIHGLQQLQATLKDFYLQNANVQHQTFVDEIQAKDNWALERARYKLTYTPASTGIQETETGKHVMFRKKLGNRWYIVWEIWNQD
ncbi:MAG TPA: hypothetical protein VK498_15785 [Ferruginibacter sp.]|nr:hypothetical protein [Ferruginibacter sp.]